MPLYEKNIKSALDCDDQETEDFINKKMNEIRTFFISFLKELIEKYDDPECTAEEFAIFSAEKNQQKVAFLNQLTQEVEVFLKNQDD